MEAFTQWMVSVIKMTTMHFFFNRTIHLIVNKQKCCINLPVKLYLQSGGESILEKKVT